MGRFFVHHRWAEVGSYSHFDVMTLFHIFVAWKRFLRLPSAIGGVKFCCVSVCYRQQNFSSLPPPPPPPPCPRDKDGIRWTMPHCNETRTLIQYVSYLSHNNVLSLLFPPFSFPFLPPPPLPFHPLHPLPPSLSLPPPFSLSTPFAPLPPPLSLPISHLLPSPLPLSL